MKTPTAARGRGAAIALMVASGFASLGYQIVWTQQAALWLGHEAAAVLAVVAAFFGGLALGSLLLGERVARSMRAARWYAGCEIAIGAWSLALAFLLEPVTHALLDVIGPQPSPLRHWSVAFLGIFALLLPATAAMGATLPAMDRVLSALRRQGTSIALLYAGNTLGAVLGVLAAAFVLVPELGLVRTAGVCAALNLCCAGSAMVLLGRSSPNPETPARTASAPGLPLWVLAVTGFLGIGVEVLVVRVLSQVAQDTIYTFAILLTVYLVGTALGAAAYARWLSGAAGADHLGDRLLRALAWTCLLGMAALAGAGRLQAATHHMVGPSMVGALLAEAMLAATAFLPATVIMGALFSHLATRANASGISLGRVLGVNTLGAAMAPPLFGVWLIPAIGAKFSLALVAFAYLLPCSRAAWKTPAQWGTAAAIVASVVAIPTLAIVNVPEGGRLLHYAEGVMGAVSVVESADGVASLHIDNHQQEGSSVTLFADARQALLPMLLHPAPRRALFLGLGTGVTASVAVQDPRLDVDAVELLPEVIEASAPFRRLVDGGDPANPRLHLLTGDARRFVRASGERYDLVVSDNFHPARSGSGSLYTVEHFSAVRERLTPGGLFCQWLPLHQLDLDTLRSIVRAFLVAYPQAAAVLATNSLSTPTVGLLGRRDAAGWDIAQVRERLASIALPQTPAAYGFDDEFALLGSFIAGPRALARFAGGTPLNTDDRPVVAYRAPRITYAPESAPIDRLLALLGEVTVAPDDVLAPSTDPAFAARLAGYWKARNLYLAAGRDVHPASDVRRMLAQVREPLLAVLRVSPEFRPAYDPLLQMAMTLMPIDAESARALLVDLQSVQPRRHEAAQALAALP